MRTAIYLGLAFLTLATFALWAEAQHVDGRIEELTFTLSQKPDGPVVGVLRNMSKVRFTVRMSPLYVEALEDGTWTTTTVEFLGCTTFDVSDHPLAAGRQIDIRVGRWMDRLQEGETIRFVVDARSGMNAGPVISNSLTFSKLKWQRQFLAVPSAPPLHSEISYAPSRDRR